MTPRRLIARLDLERPIPAPGRLLLFAAAEIQSTELVVDVRPQLGSQFHRAPEGVERLREASGSKMEVAEILGQLRQVGGVLKAMLYGAQRVVEVTVSFQRRRQVICQR